MLPELQSLILLCQGVNAVTAAIVRRAFVGAIFAERHFRHSAETISRTACGSNGTFGKDHVKLLPPGTVHSSPMEFADAAERPSQSRPQQRVLARSPVL